MILPKPRNDKSAKNLKRIRNNIKLILLEKLATLKWNESQFKITTAIFGVIEWRLKNKVYQYLRGQEMLEKKYKQGKMSWFKYQLNLFINWFNYKIRG